MTEFSVQMPPTTQVMDPNVAAAAAAQFCDQVLASPTIMFLPSWESDVTKDCLCNWTARTVTIPLATRAGTQVNFPQLHAVIRIPRYDHFTISILTAHDGICVAQASGHHTIVRQGPPSMYPFMWGGAPYAQVHHDHSNTRKLCPCILGNPAVHVAGPSEVLTDAENMGNSRNLLITAGMCLLCAGFPFAWAAQCCLPIEYVVKNNAGERIASHAIPAVISLPFPNKTMTSELRMGSLTPEQRRLALMARLYHIAIECSMSPGGGAGGV